MEDKQWNEFLASRASTDEGLVTGDSVFDEMERRLFAELDVAEEVETNSASDGTTELDQKPETLKAGAAAHNDTRYPGRYRWC